MTRGNDMERLARAMLPDNQWNIQDQECLKGPEGDRPRDGDHSAWREAGPGWAMEVMGRINAGVN